MVAQHSLNPPPGDGARRILSVDDEPGILQSRELLLQFEGYEVLSAADGEEALRLFEENPVDMVLLDYLMPGMDGEAVAREIKSKRPSIPIIIVSASPMATETRGCVDCILPKGEGPSILLSKMKQLMQSAN
jgi:CheY-like chemotaxis protein